MPKALGGFTKGSLNHSKSIQIKPKSRNLPKSDAGMHFLHPRFWIFHIVSLPLEGVRDYRVASDIGDAVGDKAELAKVQEDWKAQARCYRKKAHADVGGRGQPKANDSA